MEKGLIVFTLKDVPSLGSQVEISDIFMKDEDAKKVFEAQVSKCKSMVEIDENFSVVEELHKDRWFINYKNKTTQDWDYLSVKIMTQDIIK